MDKNPFEKIGGYAGIDIAGMFNTIKHTEPKKIDDSRVQKLWDEYEKVKSPGVHVGSLIWSDTKILDHMESILAIDPKDLDALRNKGIILMRLERYEELLEHSDELLKFYPENEFAWVMKAQFSSALRKEDSSDKIIGYYDKAIEMCILTLNETHDNNWELLLGLTFTGKANHLVDSGRTEEAQECFEKALKIDGRDYFALVGMGDILVLNVTDETKAKALVSDKWIMEHTPKPHADFVNTKAGFEAVKNRILDMFQTILEESLEYYDRAIKVNDEETLAWIKKGLAAAMLGVKLVPERSLEAKECFVKAQELVNLHKKRDWEYDIKKLIKKIEKQIEKQTEEDMQTSIEEHEEEMEQEKLREEQDNYENRKKFGL